MADFESCIDWVLRLEDRTLTGKTIDLNDGAGRTRFGIGEKYHPNLPADFYTKPSAEALVDAKNIYKQNEWTRIMGDEIPDNETAATLLSFAVNDGVVWAVEIIQKIVGAPADGHMGPKTLDLIRNWKPIVRDTLAEALREGQIDFYYELVKHNTSDRRFLDGWISRAKAKYPFLPA